MFTMTVVLFFQTEKVYIEHIIFCGIASQKVMKLTFLLVSSKTKRNVVGKIDVPATTMNHSAYEETIHGLRAFQIIHYYEFLPWTLWYDVLRVYGKDYKIQ